MPRIRNRERGEDVAPLKSTNNFSELLLSESVLKGLHAAGYLQPSPIQSKVIPLAKFGVDVIAQAKSGTGKTAVFAVAALETVDISRSHPQVLIVSPTRELAVQIQNVVVEIGRHMPLVVCDAFVGGLSIKVDQAKLLPPRVVHVAVGTPGRLKALASMPPKQGGLHVGGVRLFVLDEADRLLDDTLTPQALWLYRALPVRKQVLAFSATYPPAILEKVQSFMRNPQFVQVSGGNAVLKLVRQLAVDIGSEASSSHRLACVIAALDRVAVRQCVVFITAASHGSRYSQALTRAGWPTRHIHARMSQEERLAAVDALRNFSIRILVSSDLTARGLDAEGVNLVINADLPSDTATYLHRIGRSGRFGTDGLAISLVDSNDRKRLRQLSAEIEVDIPLVSMDELQQVANEVMQQQKGTIEHLNDGDAIDQQQEGEQVTIGTESSNNRNEDDADLALPIILRHPSDERRWGPVSNELDNVDDDEEEDEKEEEEDDDDEEDDEVSDDDDDTSDSDETSDDDDDSNKRNERRKVNPWLFYAPPPPFPPPPPPPYPYFFSSMSSPIFLPPPPPVPIELQQFCYWK